MSISHKQRRLPLLAPADDDNIELFEISMSDSVYIDCVSLDIEGCFSNIPLNGGLLKKTVHHRSEWYIAICVYRSHRHRRLHCHRRLRNCHHRRRCHHSVDRPRYRLSLLCLSVSVGKAQGASKKKLGRTESIYRFFVGKY